MLSKSPKTRITPEEALVHPFFINNGLGRNPDAPGVISIPPAKKEETKVQAAPTLNVAPVDNKTPEPGTIKLERVIPVAAQPQPVVPTKADPKNEVIQQKSPLKDPEIVPNS